MSHEPLSLRYDFEHEDTRNTSLSALAYSAEQAYREALGVVLEQVEILDREGHLPASLSEELYESVQSGDPRLHAAVKNIVSNLKERAKGHRVTLYAEEFERSIEAAGQVESLYRQARENGLSLTNQSFSTGENVSHQMLLSALRQYSREIALCFPNQIEKALEKLPDTYKSSGTSFSLPEIRNDLVLSRSSAQDRNVESHTYDHLLHSLDGYISPYSKASGAQILSHDQYSNYDPCIRLAIESASVPFDTSGRLIDLGDELSNHTADSSQESLTLDEKAFTLSFTRWANSKTLPLPGDVKVLRHRFFDSSDRVLSNTTGSISQDCLGIGHVQWPSGAVRVELELHRAEFQQLPSDLQLKILEYGQYGAAIPSVLTEMLKDSQGSQRKKLQCIVDYYTVRGIYYVNHPVLDDVMATAGSNLQPFLTGGGFGSCTHLSYILASTLNQADIPSIVIDGHYVNQDEKFYTASPGHTQVLCFLPAPVLLDPTLWVTSTKSFDANLLKTSGIVEKLSEATPKEAFALGLEATAHCLHTNTSDQQAETSDGHNLRDDSASVRSSDIPGNSKSRDQMLRLRTLENIQTLLSGRSGAHDIIEELYSMKEKSYEAYCTELYFRERAGLTSNISAEEREVGEALYQAALRFEPPFGEEYLKQLLLSKYLDNINLLLEEKTADVAYELLENLFEHIDENRVHTGLASELLKGFAYGDYINPDEFPELRKRAVILSIHDIIEDAATQDLYEREPDIVNSLYKFGALPASLRAVAEDVFYECFSEIASTPRDWLRHLFAFSQYEQEGAKYLYSYMQGNAHKTLLKPLFEDSGRLTPLALIELRYISRERFHSIFKIDGSDSDMAFEDWATSWCISMRTFEDATGQRIPLLEEDNTENRLLFEDAIRAAPNTLFSAPPDPGHIELLRKIYHEQGGSEIVRFEFVIFYLIDCGAIHENFAMINWEQKNREIGTDKVEALEEVMKHILADLASRPDRSAYNKLCADLIQLYPNDIDGLKTHFHTLHQYSIKNGNSSKSIFDSFSDEEKNIIIQITHHHLFHDENSVVLKSKLIKGAASYYRKHVSDPEDLDFVISMVRLKMKLENDRSDRALIEDTLKEHRHDWDEDAEELSFMTLLCQIESSYISQLDRFYNIGRHIVEKGQIPLNTLPLSGHSVMVKPTRGRFATRPYTSSSDQLYYYLAAAGCCVALHSEVEANIFSRSKKIADRLINTPRLTGPSKGLKAETIDVAIARRRTTRSGQEVAELAAYSFGDDLRTVDWKATARGDRVLVKRFEDPDRNRHPREFCLRVDAASIVSDTEYPSKAIIDILGFLRSEVREGRSVELEISYANSILVHWSTQVLADLIRVDPSVVLNEMWIYGVSVGSVEVKLDQYFPNRTVQPFVRSSLSSHQVLACTEDSLARVKESGCDLSRTRMLKLRNDPRKPELGEVSVIFDSMHARVLSVNNSEKLHSSPLRSTLGENS